VDRQVDLRKCKLFSSLSLQQFGLRRHKDDVVMLQTSLTSFCDGTAHLRLVIRFIIYFGLLVPVYADIIELQSFPKGLIQVLGLVSIDVLGFPL
jgi:hypothetical protein